MSATLQAIQVQSSTPPPSCPNTTCFFATPVWVPGNSSNPDDATLYVPTYPMYPIDTACPDSGLGGGEVSGTDSQPGVNAGALSLDGLSVTVTALAVQRVSTDGVSLVFWGADPFNTTMWRSNASADEVDSAVRWAIPGFAASVTRER